MKRVLFIFLIAYCNYSVSQCNVKVLNRPDGTNIKYFNPVFMGPGKDCELGCAISTNGREFLFNTAVRYFGDPKKTKGTLLIHLSNNVTLILKVFSSEFTTIKDAKLTFSVFHLTDNDVTHLNKSNIKSIVFTEADNNTQTIQVIDHADFAPKQLGCLK